VAEVDTGIQLRNSKGRHLEREAPESQVVDILSSASPPLRIPCGAQAETVSAQLRRLDDTQRRDFAFRAAATR
jgi:hypothetical protein